MMVDKPKPNKYPDPKSYSKKYTTSKPGSGQSTPGQGIPLPVMSEADHIRRMAKMREIQANPIQMDKKQIESIGDRFRELGRKARSLHFNEGIANHNTNYDPDGNYLHG
jgi:hypothetical protein